MRNINARRDKTIVLNTLTIIGVWNSNVLYLFLSIFLSCLNVAVLNQPPNKGVNNFAFFFATRFEERTNQVYLAL